MATLDEFASYQTYYQPQQQLSAFEVLKDKFLQVNLNSDGIRQVLIKHGSMVAFQGDIEFERQNLMEEGMGNLLKRTFITSEGVKFTKATLKKGPSAQLFLADNSKHVTVVRLQGDSITVNGSDVLAIETSVVNKIQHLKSISGIVSSGFFNVKLSGTGLVAFLTHGKGLVLPVASNRPPVFTDPQATVAWSGHLSPDLHTDFHFKQLFGRGSGDSFQMKFTGNGFVIVQPLEETPGMDS